MIHLFKHTSGKLKGKFDIALVIKGKVIVFSNQGYERFSGAVKAIRSVIKSFGLSDAIFQDDTSEKSIVFEMFGKSIGIHMTGKKPSKPYIPSTKK
jgi:uncharacterized protein YegP (UPF0339 family)